MLYSTIRKKQQLSKWFNCILTVSWGCCHRHIEKFELEKNFKFHQQQLQLSVFIHWRVVPALRTSLRPPSGSSPIGLCISYAGGLRAKCSAPFGVLTEESRGVESPPSTCWSRSFWCSSGCDWLSSLQAHTDSLWSNFLFTKSFSSEVLSIHSAHNLYWY